jgi:hypothetical protein
VPRLPVSAAVTIAHVHSEIPPNPPTTTTTTSSSRDCCACAHTTTKKPWPSSAHDANTTICTSLLLLVVAALLHCRAAVRAVPLLVTRRRLLEPHAREVEPLAVRAAVLGVTPHHLSVGQRAVDLAVLLLANLLFWCRCTDSPSSPSAAAAAAAAAAATATLVLLRFFLENKEATEHRCRRAGGRMIGRELWPISSVGTMWWCTLLWY